MSKRSLKKSLNTDYEFKVLAIGNSGVGKTSLLERYVHDRFSLVTRSTIGVEFYTKTVKHPERDLNIRVNLWDTAGQEKFHAVVPRYYHGSDAAVIVYDINQRDSFTDEVKKYCENPLFVLLGNKLDKEEERLVKREEGMRLAESNGMLFAETSALSSKNVNKIFSMMTFEMYNRDVIKNAKFIKLKDSENDIIIPNAIRKTEKNEVEDEGCLC